MSEVGGQERVPGPWYECQRCTACCRWPGQVRLTEGEIRRMAAHLEVPEHDFIQHYTRLRLDRRGLALLDRADGACILLEGESCRVHPVKPDQCVGFPNRWRFPGWREICRAIPVAGQHGLSCVFSSLFLLA